MIDPVLATLLGGGALLGGLRAPRGNRIEGALRGTARGGGIGLGAGLGSLAGLIAGGLGGGGLGAAIGGNEGVMPGAAIGSLSGALAGLPLGGLAGYKLVGKIMDKPSWEREGEGGEPAKKTKSRDRSKEDKKPMKKVATHALQALLKYAVGLPTLYPTSSPYGKLNNYLGAAAGALDPRKVNYANSANFNKMTLDSPLSFADSIKTGPPPIGPIVNPKPSAAPSWMDTLNSAVQGIHPGRNERTGPLYPATPLPAPRLPRNFLGDHPLYPATPLPAPRLPRNFLSDHPLYPAGSSYPRFNPSDYLL